jgi:8-oxo-dGTP diphosphatase
MQGAPVRMSRNMTETRVLLVKEIDRLAARLLILAPTGRVLMLRIWPTFRDPFWVTPGGGLDDGESFEDAARRELREEVGRSDLQLGPCIARRDVEFPWDDWLVRQHERTFLVDASDEFNAVVVHPDEEPIVGAAWFSAEELRALQETVYPDGIVGLVENATG